jgi:hypothetical protein
MASNMHTAYNMGAPCYPTTTAVPTTGKGTVPTLPAKAYPAKSGGQGSSKVWSNPATGNV